MALLEQGTCPSPSASVHVAGQGGVVCGLEHGDTADRRALGQSRFESCSRSVRVRQDLALVEYGHHKVVGYAMVLAEEDPLVDASLADVVEALERQTDGYMLGEVVHAEGQSARPVQMSQDASPGCQRSPVVSRLALAQLTVAQTHGCGTSARVPRPRTRCCRST
jgi:hypothetical protein